MTGDQEDLERTLERSVKGEVDRGPAASESPGKIKSSAPGTPYPPRTSLNDLEFSSKEQQLIDRSARWMGRVGRIQTLAAVGSLIAGFGTLLVVLWSMGTEARGQLADRPLLRLGQVEPVAVWSVFGGALFLIVVLLVSGLRLAEAGENFEHAHVSGRTHPKDALRGMMHLRAHLTAEFCLLAVGLYFLWREALG